MLEMYLRQPGFTYIACKLLTKNKERIQNFKESRDLKYIYQNKLDKTCFQNDITHREFKDSPRKQILIKYYVIKHFILLKIKSMMNRKKVLFQWFTNFR